jgi:hypothetical protein
MSRRLNNDAIMPRGSIRLMSGSGFEEILASCSPPARRFSHRNHRMKRTAVMNSTSFAAS